MDPNQTGRFPALRPMALSSDSLAPLLRRLPAYIYLADVFPGRRVLEVGCGEGAAAFWLAQAGAKQVLGVDRVPASIDAARQQHRAGGLSFRVADYGALELEDRSFDVVCVPAATDLVRWLGFLEEVRRVLAPGGNVIVCAPSADHPEARGGVSYHEIIARLSPLFGPVRLAGVTSFVGAALVEFAGEEEIAELELDTSLAELGGGRDPVLDYVAIAGPYEAPPRGYLVVEYPPGEGLDAIAHARGRPAGAAEAMLERLREAEAAHASAVARLKDLEAVTEKVRERQGARGEEAELRRRLARAVEERASAEAELALLRQRVERAEEEIGRVTGQAAVELAEARRDARETRARAKDAEAELALAREREAQALAKAAVAPVPVAPVPVAPVPVAPVPVARPPVDLDVLAEAARKHEHELAQARAVVEERDAYIEELRRELEEARASASQVAAAMAEATARGDAAEREALELRTRLARAEGELVRAGRGGRGVEPAVAAAAAAAVAADAGREAARDAEHAAELARASERWKAAESKNDDLWRKVGEMQKELEAQREQAVENARAQRHAAQVALTRAVEEASKKLVSAQDTISRQNRELAELERAVATLQGQLSEARALAPEPPAPEPPAPEPPAPAQVAEPAADEFEDVPTTAVRSPIAGGEDPS